MYRLVKAVFFGVVLCVSGLAIGKKEAIRMTAHDFRDSKASPLISLPACAKQITVSEMAAHEYKFQPISITVHNHTSNPIVLQGTSLRHVSLHAAHIKKFKHMVYTPWNVALDSNFLGYGICNLYGMLFLWPIEWLFVVEKKLQYFFIAPFSLLVSVLGWYSIKYQVFRYNRHVIAYQRKFVDEIFLTDESLYIIKPGECRRVIALVDKERYWGECGIDIFDVSRTHIIARFNVNFNTSSVAQTEVGL